MTVYPPIALLTDFGTQDAYVAQMKAVIASLAPHAKVIDITHDIRPHDVRQAGFYLSSSAAYFPAGTIFITVVDPGVGTSRDILYAKSGEYHFIAPDNGLLTNIVAESPASIYRITQAAQLTAFACAQSKSLAPANELISAAAASVSTPYNHTQQHDSSSQGAQTQKPYQQSQASSAIKNSEEQPDAQPFATPLEQLSVRQITATASQALQTSATFHGRDIFAPLAAIFWNGAAPHLLGEPATADSLVRPQWGYATGDETHISAQVLHIDRFGNIIITAPTAKWLPVIATWNCAKLTIKERYYPLALVTTYADLPSGNSVDANDNGSTSVNSHPSSDTTDEMLCSTQKTASNNSADNIFPGLLASSQGYFEIACNSTSAAAALSLCVGDEIIITAHNDS